MLTNSDFALLPVTPADFVTAVNSTLADIYKRNLNERTETQKIVDQTLGNLTEIGLMRFFEANNVLCESSNFDQNYEAKNLQDGFNTKKDVEFDNTGNVDLNVKGFGGTFSIESKSSHLPKDTDNLETFVSYCHIPIVRHMSSDVPEQDFKRDLYIQIAVNRSENSKKSFVKDLEGAGFTDVQSINANKETFCRQMYDMYNNSFYFVAWKPRNEALSFINSRSNEADRIWRYGKACYWNVKLRDARPPMTIVTNVINHVPNINVPAHAKTDPHIGTRGRQGHTHIHKHEESL